MRGDKVELHFTKMEGIGNDYVYVDGINQEVPMDAEFISRIFKSPFWYWWRWNDRYFKV